MSDFPIVKIDRTTMQEFLPIIMNRGIFSDYQNLPYKDDLLAEGRLRLGVTELTQQQEREILSSAGSYRTAAYVARDYGNYVIYFSARMYLDGLQEVEENLIESHLEEEKIERALERIRLYKLAYRLVLIILSEAYIQRKYQGLVIPKGKILNYLKYNSDDKFIYQDISDAMFSLTYLNYRIYEYRTRHKLSANTTGVFIYNVREDQVSYTVSINEVFLGCVQHLLGEKKNDKSLFRGGYINFPTAVLPLTQQYTTPAQLLAIFLLSESGNMKLRTPGLKVVTHKGSRLAEVGNICHSRLNRIKNKLLDALEEIQIIEKVEPSITDLRKVKASEVMDATIRIHLKSRKNDLDNKITSNLLGAK